MNLFSFFSRPGKGKSVFVAMSGGVDSSVSAMLLKQQGYKVTGVFITIWTPDFVVCPVAEERRDAMKVCATLDIPFMNLDLTEEYKKYVADYMISEYKAGRTPNPDVMCNKHIKFGAFLEFAKKHGADFIATGHYAQKIDKKGMAHLHEGVDRNKDQSYFLWTLTKEQLSRTLFPVGHFTKSKVRRLARKYRIPTSKKKDSQGICFLGAIDMKQFLKHYIETTPGNVVDETGTVVGHHDGAVLYTIGERHGFTITEKKVDRKPHYIVAKNISTNTLTVSTTPTRSALNPKKIALENEGWVSGTRPAPGRYTARIRYRQIKQECTLSVSDSRTIITFDVSERGLAPGQSLVLYKETECLGGGIMTMTP